jgi:hypothetical protein
MKNVSIFLIVTGLLSISLFGLADVLEPDGFGGIGAAQLLGIQSGAFLLLFGIGLWIARQQGSEFHLLRNVKLSQILDLPKIVWVGISFLFVFFFFFVKPMFLNPVLQMNYFNRYLPNTGLIGSDIRTIVGSIEGWLISGRSPYANGLIAYPPLALIFMSPLLLLEFPAYYYLVVFLSLASYILGTLVIPLAQNKSKQNSIIYILFIFGLFSYGMQFELERGQFNLIAFAICYAAIFIFHEHPKWRFFAYLLFSISIQLKIYTGIYALLFIDNWLEWKSAVRRLTGILLLNFLLLFILGTNSFNDFLNALSINQFHFPTWNGSSIHSFIFRLSRSGYGIFSENIISLAGNKPEILEMLLLLVYGLCLLTQIICSTSKNQIGFNPYMFVTCTIGLLIIPAISNDYKLPLLMGPMAILLSHLSIQGNTYKKIGFILLITIMSAAFWSILYPFEIKPDILNNNLPVLFVILFASTILNLLANDNIKRKIEKQP